MSQQTLSIDTGMKRSPTTWGKIRRWLFHLMKLAVSAGLVYWIITQIDLARLLEFFTVESGTVLAVGLLALLQWFIEFTRLRVILKNSRLSLSLSAIFRAFFMGYAFRFVLPGNQGEIGKMLFIPGRPAHRASAYVYEKAGFLLAMLILAGLGLGRLYPKYTLIGLALTGLMVVILPVWNFIVGRKFLESYVPDSLRTITPLLTQIGLSMVSITVISLQYYLLLSQFGMSLLDAGVVVVLVLAVLLLPISLAGLGLRESATAVMLATFHVPTSLGMTIPFLIFILDVALPGLVGAVFFLFSKKQALSAALPSLSPKKIWGFRRFFRPASS